MTVIGNEFFSSFLSYCGLFYIGSKLFPLFQCLYDSFFSTGKKLKEFGAGKENWAVITGCTDGIGKEFALQLAQNKFNLLLISRTKSKLDSLKEEITSQYGVEAKTLSVDFTVPGAEKYQTIKDFVKGLSVHVLINNVGLSHEHPKSLEEETEEAVTDILEINVTSTVLLTKALIPTIRESTKKSGHSGLIITVGSFSGVVPTPYLTTYSSTKAFLQTFAQSLGPELERDNIVVSNIIPYFVVSKMSKIRKTSFLIPSPKVYVKSVLSKIGLKGGAAYPYNSIPYPGHALIGWAIEAFGTRRFWINFNRGNLVFKFKYTNNVLDGMLKTRARALKKKQLSENATPSATKND